MRTTLVRPIENQGPPDFDQCISRRPHSVLQKTYESNFRFMFIKNGNCCPDQLTKIRWNLLHVNY